MIHLFPPFAQIVILGGLGLAIGVFINWAIYRWAMFLKRSISPFLTPDIGAGESPRQAIDFVPIIGWPGRARDKKVHGRGFWFRPLAIEIVWMIGLPLLYFWLASDGLTGDGARNPPLIPSSLKAETWFWLYTIFLALLTIGTFIDFDEKTIPDEVTIPGTLIALSFAALAPWSRLPEVVGGGMKPALIGSIDHGVKAWHGQEAGLAVGLLIFAIWIWALMPKLPPWYVGFGTSLKFMYAHAFRPKRKTKCELRTRPRTMPGVTQFLVGLLVVGLTGITLAWCWLPPANWQSLYGSLVGLAFGGCMIWSIRIIGTYALQKEAMGFGDVTLMAMIGATLGWQATLIAFVYAMVVVVLALVIQIIATGNQALAFGPYLCAGAALTIFRWKITWPFAERSVFGLGDFVWWLLGASMILMAVMLLGLQWIKGVLGIGVDEDEIESP
jgi:prepilin signal peptidase PulO-like enzyme (type II secretory pathway)